MNEHELFAAKKNELQEGEMKEIEWNEIKIILAKVNGEYYAVGGTCPHYKAPLVKGALCGTKLYCPWHHSVFDIKNGSLLEPPALDGLPRYDVLQKGENIFIKISEKNEGKSNTVNEDLTAKTFVIVGGGAAGMFAAKTLREQGFGGRLVMITKENELPYDRTALSKKYLSGKQKKEELPLKKDDFFGEQNIEVIKDKEIKRIDFNCHILLFSDNVSLPYHKLLIATGGAPQKLAVPGSHLQNVFTLRIAEDAEKILTASKTAKKACIIGASFIALETAASLRSSGLDVTVIAKEKLPFEKKFGEAVGKIFLSLHKEKGIIIKTETEMERIEGDKKAEAVMLKSGERIETDLVIAGIGVHPVTDFIDKEFVNEKDKSVLANEMLQVSEDVYAAGDITRYNDPKTGESIRIEHWRVAQQHGKIAALNMLGGHHTINEIVPFFWTNQFEKRLSYVGHAEEWHEIQIDGNVEEQTFLAFYVKDNKVLAAASMNRDKDSNRIENIMLTHDPLSPEEWKEKLGS